MHINMIYIYIYTYTDVDVKNIYTKCNKVLDSYIQLHPISDPKSINRNLDMPRHDWLIRCSTLQFSVFG